MLPCPASHQVNVASCHLTIVRRCHLLDVGSDVRTERIDDQRDLVPLFFLVERRQNLFDVDDAAAGRQTALIRLDDVYGGLLGS